MIKSYELWYEVKPKVHHYRIFSTIAYIFIDKSKCSKFDPKANQMIFVEYSSINKAWRFWKPKMPSIIESADVIFYEKTYYSQELFKSSTNLFTISLNQQHFSNHFRSTCKNTN